MAIEIKLLPGLPLGNPRIRDLADVSIAEDPVVSGGVLYWQTATETDLGVWKVGASLPSLSIDSLSVGGYTFPATDGLTDQYLRTDGAGNLSFVDLPVASNAQKGIANFNSESFQVNDGAVSIKTAGVSNDQLVNNSLILGTTNIALGGSTTSITGLNSVSSVSFSGELFGNAVSAYKLHAPSTFTIGNTTKSFDGTENLSWSVADIGAVVANAAITAGTFTKISFDEKGLVVSGESLSASDIPDIDASKITTGTFASNRMPAFSGDFTTTNGSTVATLTSSGVAPGTYTKITVDAKGRATTGTSLNASDIPALDWSKITTGKPTTIAGYGITDDLKLGNTAGAAPNTASAGVATTAARSDHVHPVQTSVSGNAGTATKLQTARTINGVSFDGSANITINAVDSTARIAVSEKGAPNGVATLGADGIIPATQLPAYIDDVGLSNVDNTSDADKPISTATQTALNLKAPLASPTFTGTPAAPTAAAGTNTTQVATTAHVFAERSNTATLTNKTVNLSNNTLTGTLAQFNTALSDADFASLTGIETLTNKTINLSNNTLTGTVAQFNTALSDGDFATIAGTETLSNKTINLTNNTVSGTLAQFNAAVSDADLVSIAGTETLTNKTLTTPTLSGTASGTGAGKLGYLSGALSYGNGTVQRTVVNTDETQTLTNKTLTTVTISSGTISGSDIAYLAGLTSPIQTQLGNIETALATILGT